MDLGPWFVGRVECSEARRPRAWAARWASLRDTALDPPYNSLAAIYSVRNSKIKSARMTKRSVDAPACSVPSNTSSFVLASKRLWGHPRFPGATKWVAPFTIRHSTESGWPLFAAMVRMISLNSTVHPPRALTHGLPRHRCQDLTE